MPLVAKIEVDPETYALLEQRAAEQGITVQEYLALAVARYGTPPPSS